MARPPKLTPEQSEIIRDARRSGASAAEIAHEVNVPLRTVQRALAGTPAPASAAEDPLEIAPILAALDAKSVATGRDMLEIATAAVERVNTIAQRELAAGNVTAYTGLLKRQTELITAVRQLEAQRARETAADSVTFTHEELAQGAREVAERLQALEADRIANGGLFCGRCSEELRMADAVRSIGEDAGPARH